MRILIAEDDFASRKAILKFLSAYGECDVTVDGMEAIDAFMMALEEEDPYDLICLDVMMPVMDGYQALKNIRDIEREHNVDPADQARVIMTTALNEEKNVKKAFCMCFFKKGQSRRNNAYSGKYYDRENGYAFGIQRQYRKYDINRIGSYSDIK